jgi:hypothetical protein
MNKKINHLVRHGTDLFILVLIFSFCFGGLFYFRFDVASQIAIVILMGVLYVCWGVFHHYHDGDLSGKIFSEYFLMSALITTILSVFLLRL